MHRPGDFFFIILLGLVFAAGTVGVDIIAPAQPSIGLSFDADQTATQQIMSAYFIGLAIAQIIFGPLSDRFGRKPVLRFGLWAFAACTFTCIFASTIDALIALRFLQGAFASSGLVVARAIARDHFENPALGRVVAYMGLTLSLSPVLLPPLGGILAGAFGWRANAVFLAALVTVTALWMEFGLKESLSETNRRPIQPWRTLKTFLEILRNGRFLGFMITGSICFSGLFAFIANSSFVFKDYFGASIEHYGFLVGLAFVGHSIGAFLGGRMVVTFGSERLITAGAFICALSGAIMAAVQILIGNNALTISALMFIYLFGAGFVYPQSLAGALHPFPKFAGAASALMGFFVMLTSGLTSAILSRIDSVTPFGMTMFVACVGILTPLVFVFFVRPRLSAAVA